MGKNVPGQNVGVLGA